jgi:methylenetetrahydrofolate reductase (NADPH)
MQALRHWSVRHAAGLKRVYDGLARCLPYLDGATRMVGRARSERLLTPLEAAAKGLLFDCQMCGQCVLSSTGMACPTNCAKQMRNGPCGGVRADGTCEVDRAMRCVWVEATEGRKNIAGSEAAKAPMLAPIDHRLEHHSSWIRVIAGDAPETLVARETMPPREREAYSFERACKSGRLVVTVEVAPPDSADSQALVERAKRFKDLADAVNITDGPGGNCHMSSAAAATMLAVNGLTPICQMACRDRNRIAMQGDLLGMAALGVRNVLCLTGDDVSQGDQPQAKPVFDLDAVSLLRIATDMVERATFASGRKLEVAPNLFLGATANPFVPPFADRVANLELKIDAGARFIQTQFCFDPEMLKQFMREVRVRELHKRATIIIGVGTLSSAKSLRWMAEHVPGVRIPERVIVRIAGAADQRAEAKRVLIETIHAVTEIEGVGGVHLMSHKHERLLAETIVEAGLRQPSTAAPAPA